MAITNTCETKDHLSLEHLTPFQGNIKMMTLLNLQKLQNRIKKSGINVPFFVWKHDNKNYILDGHQRYTALKDLKAKGYVLPDALPVVFIEAADEKDAREKLLAISSQYGVWNREPLREFTNELDISDMRLPGDEFVLDFHKQKTSGDDELPEEFITYTAEPGDRWKLGEHLLICGDSTQASTYDLLCGDNKMHLVLTDPPYNMGHTGSTTTSWRAKWNEEDMRDETIENDDMTPEDFEQFICNFLTHTKAHCLPQASYYMFSGRSNYSQMRDYFERTIGHISTDIVWFKGMNVALQPDAYSKSYENLIHASPALAENEQANQLLDREECPEYEATYEKIIYGFQNEVFKEKYFQTDGTKKIDTWFFKPVTKKSERYHPTQKTVDMLVYALHNSSGIGNNVIDPFGGSGSTLIACEKMHRKCFMIEKDPQFIEAIINRYKAWCDANKKVAVVEKLNGIQDTTINH